MGNIVAAIATATAIGFDTAPFIYYFEKHPTFYPAIEPVIRWVEQRETVVIYTSVVSVIETTVFPLRNERHDLVAQYRQALLHSSNVYTLPLDADIAERAAQLRADYNLRTPDAIQLATCIHMKCDVFITNDRGVRSVKEIPVLYLADYV